MTLIKKKSKMLLFFLICFFNPPYDITLSKNHVSGYIMKKVDKSLETLYPDVDTPKNHAILLIFFDFLVINLLFSPLFYETMNLLFA